MILAGVNVRLLCVNPSFMYIFVDDNHPVLTKFSPKLVPKDPINKVWVNVMERNRSQAIIPSGDCLAIGAHMRQWAPIVWILIVDGVYVMHYLICRAFNLMSCKHVEGISWNPVNLTVRIYDGPLYLNSLWPSDAIWWQISESTLAQVMACCLTAPSHYLNQCWLIISEVQWHSY